MGSTETHRELYGKFKEDAENSELFEGTRVEAYFLSAFHLIEACAAEEHIHINKHQNVRPVLEENQFLFEENTETVWRSFQRIENQLRPKFAYAFSWTEEDLEAVKDNYRSIEKSCLENIEKSCLEKLGNVR